MTIHITKFKAVVALLVVALLVPATAFATHSFSDVEHGNYYTDAVEWAADNGVTTGTSATTFSPHDAVTRAQNVTFAYRYDQNVVQPALTELAANAPEIWAIEVDKDGVKLDGSAGTFAEKGSIGSGRYYVGFPVTDVHDCSWIGTIAHESDSIFGLDDPGASIALASGYPASATRDVDEIFVEINDDEGSGFDSPFHVVLMCLP